MDWHAPVEPTTGEATVGPVLKSVYVLVDTTEEYPPEVELLGEQSKSRRKLQPGNVKSS